MNSKGLLVLCLSLYLLVSCKSEKSGPLVITDQIVYDVQLKNPDSIPDTWHKYMDDSTRIHFLNNLVKPVLAGEVQAYIMEDKLRPATTEELKKRFEWDKSKIYPIDIDTINYLVHRDHITKIRYFEEWSMHRKSLQVDKRVLGISLIQDNYDETGMFRGTEPLFYIFYDKDFATKFGK